MKKLKLFFNDTPLLKLNLGRRISCYFCVALFLALTSCGTTNVNVTVTRPAEVNMLRFKKIIVGEFTGEHGNRFSNDVTAALIQGGRFEIIDKIFLTKALYDYGLSYEGAVKNGMSEQAISKIGYIALIHGDVTKHHYKEDVIEGESYKDDKKKVHHPYTRVGKASMGAHFQVTDLVTGKIIFLRDFSRDIEVTKSSVDVKPEKINRDEVLDDLRNTIINDFLKRILPYNEVVSVSLFNDEDVPEFETGIKYAKSGFWDKAVETFQFGTKSANNNELKGKAFYNLGIAYQYSYMFPDAIEAFDRAFKLDGQDKYLSAMNNCRNMEFEYKKLLEQTK